MIEPVTFVPIIGAARSGTKMLRDTLAGAINADRVPYDVNYLWRIGNEHRPNDYIPESEADPRVLTDIRGALLRFSTGRPIMVEKTVSNCLRIPYVARVFPGAKFVILTRDGYDIIESSRRQWTARPDWKYVLAKARTFPIAKAPGYALGYLSATVRRLVGRRTKQPPFWGPRYIGMTADVQSKPLIEVCAIQWLRCMEGIRDGLNALDRQDWIAVRYEDIARNPADSLAKIARFTATDMCPAASAVSNVRSDRLGVGTKTLSDSEVQLVRPYVEAGTRIIEEIHACH